MLSFFLIEILLILCEFHNIPFDLICPHYSSLIYPNFLHTQTLCLVFKNSLSSKIMLPLYCWFWGHPLEHSQPTATTSLKKSNSSRWSLQLSIAHLSAVGAHDLFHSPCGSVDCLDPLQVLTQATTANIQ